MPYLYIIYLNDAKKQKTHHIYHLYIAMFWAQSEIPVHDILHKLLNLRHENLPCILDVPSRRA